MSKKKLWGVLVAVVAIGLSAQSALAASISRVVENQPLTGVTGNELCQPTIPKSRRYATIQAAVDDSIASAYPSTIWVCPGYYPEQVHIYDTATYAPIITLQGVNLGSTYGAAVITAPQNGLVPNFDSGISGWVAAQLLVTDTTGVTINHLEVNGTGAGCPTMGANTAGIMFANNGNPATSNWEAGTIQFVNVHDQLPACGLSAGIVAENAYIQINSNTIVNINYVGILEYGGNAKMLGNKISNTGFLPTTGILSSAAHPVDVSLNVISNVQFGIVLENGTNSVQVDKNNISATISTGIYLHGASNNLVRGNTVDSASWGISLDGGGSQPQISAWTRTYINAVWPSSGNLVQGNSVSNCGDRCIADSWSSGANRIDLNTLTHSLNDGIWLEGVAYFLQNGTAPAPPPAPFLDWDSIYSNLYIDIPVPLFCADTCVASAPG
jgi:parallel beta-helix repeat protein